MREKKFRTKYNDLRCFRNRELKWISVLSERRKVKLRLFELREIFKIINETDLYSSENFQTIFVFSNN